VLRTVPSSAPSDVTVLNDFTNNAVRVAWSLSVVFLFAPLVYLKYLQLHFPMYYGDILRIDLKISVIIALQAL